LFSRAVYEAPCSSRVSSIRAVHSHQKTFAHGGIMISLANPSPYRRPSGQEGRFLKAFQAGSPCSVSFWRSHPSCALRKTPPSTDGHRCLGCGCRQCAAHPQQLCHRPGKNRGFQLRRRLPLRQRRHRTYTLDATASGFQKYTKTGIVVNVAATLEEDISFKVGSATQTVSVQAEALQTQTETSEVSTLISGQQVEELSTNGNNVTALAALGLGVSNNLPSFSGVDALTSANGISFNGTARRTISTCSTALSKTTADAAAAS